MAYSTNPNLPKARAIAMQLLIREQLPLKVVANHCGVHRSTIWRWKRKWNRLNKYIQLDNPNRPSRAVGSSKLARCKWNIATKPSRPHTSPTAISATVIARILYLRNTLKRCAEVVWHYITHIDGIRVSLSSVRRILRRHHCFDGTRKKRVLPDNPKRPHVTKPGELIQIDTIHHVDPNSGKRLYIYTVIDLYTRMAYAMLSTTLRQGQAIRAVLNAQKVFGFSFAMVQSDNGAEFSRYFEQTLDKHIIVVRHTRLSRPNDNAHIERFNRTLQEECIGHYWRKNISLPRQQAKLANYLDYYNNERVHLGLQLLTPIQMLQRS